MPILPTDANDTPNYTPAQHATHHNVLAGLNNQLGNFVQSTIAPVGPVSGDLWLDTDEPASSQVEVFALAASDETTAITTGTAKLTFRMPFAMILTAVRASLTTASSSGLPTFDINENGTTILSTKLSIDVSEKTSTTATTPAVISDANLADDAEMTIDFDIAGTGAKGVKIYLIGYRV